MPAPNRRDEPDDPGYEVVESPPARPVRAKPVAAKPVAAKPVAPPPPKKPKVTVVEDDEDDRPRKKSRPRDEDDEDEDDRPRKKKRRKKGAAVGIDDETNSLLAEWGPAAFMVLVGLILTSVGSYGIASRPDFGISPAIMVVSRIIVELISIPIIIVALICIGSVFGIEYGTLVSAVRNLAAILFLVGGMMDIFDWAKLPFFVTQPIVFLVAVGLLMTLFRLDMWETIVTVFGLNLLSWAFQIAAVFLILMILSKGGNRDRDDDFDSSPKVKQKQGGNDDRRWQKGNDPDDFNDPDDR